MREIGERGASERVRQGETERERERLREEEREEEGRETGRERGETGQMDMWKEGYGQREKERVR